MTIPAPECRLKWDAVALEAPGMVVINRYRRSPNILPPAREALAAGDLTGAKTVFARTTFRAEKKELQATIALLEDLLAHEDKQVALIKDEMQAVITEFADDRQLGRGGDAVESSGAGQGLAAVPGRPRHR